MIGREKEKQYLEDYLDSGKSEFIAVYGRRRVGKTFLIRQVIGDKACFSLTGMENADLRDQLANFFFLFTPSLSTGCSPQIVDRGF